MKKTGYVNELRYCVTPCPLVLPSGGGGGWVSVLEFTLGQLNKVYLFKVYLVREVVLLQSFPFGIHINYSFSILERGSVGKKIRLNYLPFTS